MNSNKQLFDSLIFNPVTSGGYKWKNRLDPATVKEFIDAYHQEETSQDTLIEIWDKYKVCDEFIVETSKYIPKPNPLYSIILSMLNKEKEEEIGCGCSSCKGDCWGNGMCEDCIDGATGMCHWCGDCKESHKDGIPKECPDYEESDEDE
jgi:hypothetical protein